MVYFVSVLLLVMCATAILLKYPFEGNVLKHFCSSTEKDVNLFFSPF